MQFSCRIPPKLIVSSLTRSLLSSLLLLPRSEGVHDSGENDEEDTTSGTESQNLGNESLVQSGETLLLENGANGREGPVILGNDTRDLGGVLNSALDDIQGGVENGTNGTTDGTGDEIVDHLALLGIGLGEELSDLENAAKVTSVPEDVAPESALKTLVEGKGALILDSLDDTVNHTVVLSSRGLVLETNLDELEGNDDERLGGTSGSTSEDGERLVHLADTESVAVELSPLVVGGELGSSLGSLHENGGRDTAVESRETLVLDDLSEAVEHASVGVSASSAGSLQLNSGLDNIKRVHDQNLRNTSNGACGELVLEGEGLLGGSHDGDGTGLDLGKMDKTDQTTDRQGRKKRGERSERSREGKVSRQKGQREFLGSRVSLIGSSDN